MLLRCQMGKLFFSLGILFQIIVSANMLLPAQSYKASGPVTDIIVDDEVIMVSTGVGAIDFFDIKNKTLLKSVTIPNIKDFMGDMVEAKIYNLDLYKNKLLFTAQAAKGFREVFLYENNTLTKIISSQEQMLIAEAKFINENEIVLSTLGNEMSRYNYKEKKTIWTINVKRERDSFNSKFSDLAINETRNLVVVADESGDLKIIDITKGKIVQYLTARNLDNVFKVDFKNNKIITAGQDGKCVFYNLTKDKDYYLREKRWFLIYAAGLSPTGNRGAFSSDEENNVIVFDTKSKEKLYTLTGNIMTLSSIVFINEKELFVTSDSNQFNYYNLKEK